MTEILGLLSAFGISAPAGLNAYVPLLIVGLTARLTDWFKLSAPFDLLSNEWVLGVLAVLATLEFFVDKIPGVDTVNDLVSTFVRPTAGAVLFASSNNVISDVHPALALICGFLAAGGVHAIKSSARPLVTAMSGGVGNPFVSVIEDAVAFVATIAAIFAPVLILMFLIALAVFGVAIWRFRGSGRLTATA